MGQKIRSRKREHSRRMELNRGGSETGKLTTSHSIKIVCGLFLCKPIIAQFFHFLPLTAPATVSRSTSYWRLCMMTGNDSDNYLDASNDSFSMLSKISIELNILSLIYL